MKLPNLELPSVSIYSARDPEQRLREMKGLEWIFIIIRWLEVPTIILMTWLHNPIHPNVMIAVAGVLGLFNAIACFLNIRISDVEGQRALSFTMLIVHAMVAWGLIFLFVREFYTPAYAIFALIIIEAAIRFGLRGSMAMAIVFIIGLYEAMIFRGWTFDVRFSTSGYAFWTLLMLLIALAVGIVAHKGQKYRFQSEHLLEERALIMERNRIARDLHDSVLKTLQGLAMEACVLRSRASETSPFVEQKAHYIEEVCRRCSQEIRNLIFELHVGEQEEGIGIQLSKTLTAWSKNAGIASEFVLSGNDRMVSPSTTHNLRSILLEALSNIQKHAYASQVYVSVKILANEICIDVGDNGRGLGFAQNGLYSFVSAGKMGIVTMKERVESLEGRFSMESDQHGTRIYAVVPLHNSSILSEARDETDNHSHCR